MKMIELEVPGKSFKEFADSVVEHRYIGICHGEAGVGKSLAASYYAKWHEKVKDENAVSELSEESKDMKRCKAVLITATVTNTPKIIKQQIMMRVCGFGRAYTKHSGEKDIEKILINSEKFCPLVIVDEADRLNINSLEEAKNLYDRYQFGLIFIGMPGIEKRFSRYPQLYSRLGFSHEFRKLSEDEMKFLFPKMWKSFKIPFNSDLFSDVEALNTMIKITGGNFRLIDRLFSQIKRILKINNLNVTLYAFVALNFRPLSR